MGLYDSIDVRECTLEIERSESNYIYQTHNLGRDLYYYKLNASNQLTYDDHVVIFNGDMEIIAYIPKQGTRFVLLTYRLTFIDSKVVTVVKVSEVEYNAAITKDVFQTILNDGSS